MPYTPELPKRCVAALLQWIDPATERQVQWARPPEVTVLRQPQEIQGVHVSLQLTLGYPLSPVEKTRWTAAIHTYMAERFSGVAVWDVTWVSRIPAYAISPERARLPAITNLIAVAAGKGGVGKSTVSAGLALALAARGARVGVLDADIYGPSQPAIFGAVHHKAVSDTGAQFSPIEAYGIRWISMGLLVDPLTPMVWRGPMVSKALSQLLYQTAWGPLDYLLVDMPPGTGDVALTLCQKMPLAGVVLVTSPDPLAFQDVARAAQMFVTLEVPLLGVIENMQSHTCMHCGHTHVLPGTAATDLAQAYGFPVLGQIPDTLAVRHAAITGVPLLVSAPEDPFSQAVSQIALRAAAFLAERPKDLRRVLPTRSEGGRTNHEETSGEREK